MNACGFKCLTTLGNILWLLAYKFKQRKREFQSDVLKKVTNIQRVVCLMKKGPLNFTMQGSSMHQCLTSVTPQHLQVYRNRSVQHWYSLRDSPWASQSRSVWHIAVSLSLSPVHVPTLQYHPCTGCCKEWPEHPQLIINIKVNMFSEIENETLNSSSMYSNLKPEKHYPSLLFKCICILEATLKGCRWMVS